MKTTKKMYSDEGVSKLALGAYQLAAKRGEGPVTDSGAVPRDSGVGDMVGALPDDTTSTEGLGCQLNTSSSRSARDLSGAWGLDDIMLFALKRLGDSGVSVTYSVEAEIKGYPGWWGEGGDDRLRHVSFCLPDSLLTQHGRSGLEQNE